MHFVWLSHAERKKGHEIRQAVAGEAEKSVQKKRNDGVEVETTATTAAAKIANDIKLAWTHIS